MPHATMSSKPARHRLGGPAAFKLPVARLALTALALVVGGTLLCGLLGLIEMHAQDAVIAQAPTPDAPDAPDSLAGAGSALHAAQRR